MTQIELTDHARIRIQQRGIPEQILPYLFKYGKKTYDNRGGKVLFLNKEGRERMKRECGRGLIRQLGEKLDIYAVINHVNGVVTVGHRYRRINRE